MKKAIIGLTGLVLVSLLSLYCQKDQTKALLDGDLYPITWPDGFDPPVIPADNALTAARVALGKRLFYDPILSRDSSISCNSCHKQEYAFADDLPVSPGVKDRLGFRNAPSLANVAWLQQVNRDGGVVKLDLQATVPIEDENEMDFTLLQAAERLNRQPEYEKLCQQAYGRPADPFVITRALGAFQRTLVSGDSPYDRYVFQHQTNALTESQKRGMALFFGEKASCGHCHSGFNLTNNQFENNGLYEQYGEDTGRRRITLREADDGRFRVPSLRNVALTAPYMHDGILTSLETVVEHYNSGGSHHPQKNPLIRPLNLSTEEKADLIHFLESLTDSTFILNPEYR